MTWPKQDKIFFALLCLLICTGPIAGCAYRLAELTESRGAAATDSLHDHAAPLDDAPIDFEQLMAQSGGGSPAEQMSLARVAEKRRLFAEAKAIYHDVMAQQPGNPLPAHRLGVILARQGKFEEAHTHFANALELAPDNVPLLSDTAYACYLDNRLADAEGFLLRALALDPHHKASGNNLGLVYGAQERYAESLELFRRERGEAQAQANLGYVLAQQGEFEGAQKCYLRALTLDHTLRPVAEAMLQVAAHDQIFQSPGDTPDATTPDDGVPDETATADISTGRAITKASISESTITASSMAAARMAEETPPRAMGMPPAATVQAGHTARHESLDPPARHVRPAHYQMPVQSPPVSHWPAVPAIQSPIGPPASTMPFSLRPPEEAAPISQWGK